MKPIITGVVLAVSTPLGAQQLDRAVRPTPTPSATFAFPATHVHTLPNGLRLLVVENRSLPVVSVRAVIATDSTWDPPGKEGLFAVTLGALREGSTKRTADEFARAAAAIGTTVTPTSFTTVSSAFEPALELMAEMLTQPAFDSAGIEHRKAQQSAVARRVAQTPVTIPRRLFYAIAFDATDPFVRSLQPTEASVAAITRADVTRFYDEFFSPRTATIVVVGDVSEAVAAAAVARQFGTWSPRGTPPAAAEMHARVNDTKIYLHDVSGPQAYLFVGSLGPSRDSADLAAAETFGVVAATRLQQVLREKRSFMYSGTTGFTWRHGFAGTFVGATTVSPQKADSALREWLGILRGIRTEQPVTAEELEAARRNRIGSLPARIDGPDSIATRLVEITRDGLPADYFEQYAKRMSSVTAAQVTAAANRYADPSHLIIVVTGDRSVLEPALRVAQLGPVIVVDALGKPVP